MAIYHFSVKTLSRSSGRSATAAAAYRAGEKIRDDRTGEVFDYTKKGGILVSEILIPQGIQTPDWITDRARLWNEAEKAETRINSRVAREAEIALPHELPPDEREALTRQLAQLIADRYKVPVDYSIHEPARNGDDRNHHAHILFATREIDQDGFGKKTRVLDAHETGPDQIDQLRTDWADLINRAFERLGIPERVDSRTLEAQGINREPTQHLGPDATAMERRGETTALGDFNRAAQQTPQQDRASQPKQSGELSRKERRELVATLYAQSDGPAAFQDALSGNGFTLATGDRRPFVVIDSKGAPYNLARLIPEATNDSLRDYFTPILDNIPDTARALEAQQEPPTPEHLKSAFNEAAAPPGPDLKDVFNKKAKPPTDPNREFFEAQKLQTIERLLSEHQALIEKHNAQHDKKEALWAEKIEAAREKLAKKQEARQLREEKAREPKGLLAVWEEFKDKINPARVEARLEEQSRLDAQRQGREASERLALEAKLQEVLEQKRAALEAQQEQERQDLERQHYERIERAIREEDARRRILEEYHRAQQIRDRTREDNERERGRDR